MCLRACRCRNKSFKFLIEILVAAQKPAKSQPSQASTTGLARPAHFAEKDWFLVTSKVLVNAWWYRGLALGMDGSDENEEVTKK